MDALYYKKKERITKLFFHILAALLTRLIYDQGYALKPTIAPLLKFCPSRLAFKISIFKGSTNFFFLKKKEKKKDSLLIAFVNMGPVDYIHPVVADRRLNFA